MQFSVGFRRDDTWAKTWRRCGASQPEEITLQSWQGRYASYVSGRVKEILVWAGIDWGWDAIGEVMGTSVIKPGAKPC